MNIIFNVIKRLLPIGNAWSITSECIKLFTEGITLQFERIKDFYSGTRTDFIPDTSVDLIEEWYKTLGMNYNPTLPISELQNKAKAFDTAIGGQNIVYIQNQIDDANINVTIEELSYPPETRVGNSECRCGVAYCFGNPYDVKSPESGVCGIGRTGIARTGFVELQSSLLFYYYVIGSVLNREEFTQLIALLERLAPAHLEPIFNVDVLSFYARAGVAVCGITRTGND